MYSVKEAFYTLQGEGGQAGRASVFCRFTGCNLWSGREKDRASSICRFCDTYRLARTAEDFERPASLPIILLRCGHNRRIMHAPMWSSPAESPCSSWIAP